MNEILNQTFGRLTVQGIGKIKGYYTCLCECTCGNRKLVQKSSLLNGLTKSCGCLHREKLLERRQTHGMSSSREYMSWQDMKKRCYCPETKCFHNYGGHAIPVQVCERYRESFEEFFEDLGYCESGMTLDRKSSHGHYSCGKCEECETNGWTMNVRWATRKIQARNRRENFRVKYKGEDWLFAELCENLNKPYKLVYNRINFLGWSVEDAVDKSPNEKRPTAV